MHGLVLPLATPGQRGLEIGVRVPDWTDAATGDNRLFVRTFVFQSVVNGNACEVTGHCT